MPIPTSISDLSTTAASNSPQGSESPTEGDNYIRALSSIIKTQDNVRAQFQTDVADTTSASNGDALIGVKYVTSNSAALNLHSYIEDDGAYNVMGFIAEGLKSAIRDNTSTTDLDTQIQNALTAAQADNRPGLRFPRGRFNINAGVSLTMTGNRLTGGFTVRGAGPNQTFIRQTGTPADALIAFQSATPTLSTTTNPFEFSHLTLLGSGATCNGLLLNSVAEFHVHHVVADSFTQAMDLRSSLVGLIEMNHFSSSTNGIRSRLTGTSSYNNAVTVRNNEIKFNTGFAMDLGASNGWWIENNDIEQNGTTANTATGAVMIRNTCDDEVGFAQIHFVRNWFEQNLGRCIQTESMSGNFFDLIVVGGHCVGQESGRVMTINPLRRLSISDFHAPSASDTVDISCDQLLIQNSYIGVITETAVTTSTYDNVSTVAGDYVDGRPYAPTLTLTGCTTSPTTSSSFIKQGKFVRGRITGVSATSNTTAATLTGLPAVLRPSANRIVFGVCIDNGVSKISQVVIGSSGTITLNNALSATFTNSGTKGLDTLDLVWEI
jgi:hypothetical protein